MTDVCVISCDRISSDYWFTIKRGHYQETVDEVDTSAKEIVSSIRTPGNTDIVIYRGSSKCLYINLQVSARIQWMMRAYAVIAGRMLFGSDIWELRNRYKWYTLKHSKASEDESAEGGTDGDIDVSPGKVREAIYETILSIDSIAAASSDNDSPFDFIKDPHALPDEKAEIGELGKAIREAIATLPQKDRLVVEYRFYRNMQVKEIAEQVGLSSSRITRIVQSALNHVREYLVAHEHYGY